MHKPSCSQNKPKLVLNFESVDCDIHRSYWAVLSFTTVTLHNEVVLTLGSVVEVLRGHCYWAVLSCDAVYYAVQGGSNF